MALYLLMLLTSKFVFGSATIAACLHRLQIERASMISPRLRKPKIMDKMSSLLSKAKIGVDGSCAVAMAMELLLKDNFSFFLGGIGIGMGMFIISAQYQNL